MTKPYFNELVIGNSAMLGCLDGKGELIRLCWPDIDFPQHIDRLIVGIVCPQIRPETLWMHCGEWSTEQHYEEDANIAVTNYLSDQYGLRVTQTDFVLPQEIIPAGAGSVDGNGFVGADSGHLYPGESAAVLTRCYEIENMGAFAIETGFVVYSSAISTGRHPAGTMYEQSLQALIHYKHAYYYCIISAETASGYQIGGNAEHNAGRGSLSGVDIVGMSKDGALLWEKKTIPVGGRLKFTLHICMARELKTLKRTAAAAARSDSAVLLEKTRDYWRDYLNRLRRVNTGDPAIDTLYRRSLLIFALMANKRTGALLAAPEVDEECGRCGGYAYCWGRDAAFITAALDKVGLHAETERFYEWAASVQDDDGGWQQRYHMDGSLAPSWGLQIDETGSIIYGMLRHYEMCRDISFLAGLWPCVRKAAGFMASYVDAETGLPWLSFDLWEERLGEHAYSSSAVCAGLEAGAAIAEILAGAHTGMRESAGELAQLARVWREAAADMRAAIDRNFWRTELNRFIRSVRVKLNPWGEEPPGSKVRLRLTPIGCDRDYSAADETVDISLLGLCEPFGLYGADDPRMEATAQAIEKALSGSPAGGLMRYERDGYIGGNPWIIATLWAALYHIRKKSFEKAKDYFYWALSGATKNGLLPEQADRETGRPAWVFALTWSHAMFVLVLDELVRAGVI